MAEEIKIKETADGPTTRGKTASHSLADISHKAGKVKPAAKPVAEVELAVPKPANEPLPDFSERPKRKSPVLAILFICLGLILVLLSVAWYFFDVPLW